MSAGWYAACNGSSKMCWYVMRDSTPVDRKAGWGSIVMLAKPSGRDWRRYGSREAAQKMADKLNTQERAMRHLAGIRPSLELPEPKAMSRAPDLTVAETRAMLDDFTKDVECDTTADKLWWVLTSLMDLCKAEGLDFHVQCRAARADWLEHNTGVRR